LSSLIDFSNRAFDLPEDLRRKIVSRLRALAILATGANQSFLSYDLLAWPKTILFGQSEGICLSASAVQTLHAVSAGATLEKKNSEVLDCTPCHQLGSATGRGARY